VKVLSRTSVAVVGLVAGLLGAPAASAAAVSTSAPPPGLSITVTDNTTQTAPGADLTYVTKVANAGVKSVKGILVIELPAYVTYAGGTHAAVKGQDASWAVTIPAGGSVSRSVGAHVGTIPHGELRVTTLASLYLSTHATQPLVRTAESNTIRGVVDTAHTVGAPPPVSSGALPLWVIVGAAALVVLIALTVVLLARRQRMTAKS
jgi:hypothetical protein